MAKQKIPLEKLDALMKSEMARAGFAGVTSISLYKVVQPGTPANWDNGYCNFGPNEPMEAATVFTVRVKPELQRLYDVDWPIV